MSHTLKFCFILMVALLCNISFANAEETKGNPIEDLIGVFKGKPEKPTDQVESVSPALPDQNPSGSPQESNQKSEKPADHAESVDPTLPGKTAAEGTKGNLIEDMIGGVAGVFKKRPQKATYRVESVSPTLPGQNPYSAPQEHQ